MPSWVLKAATQKILSALPAAHALNRFFQKRVTRSLDLTDDRLTAQLGRCARHLEAYVGLRGRIPDTVLEVGTGWLPILPLGFHLCGCREIWTVDRVPLMTAVEARRTVVRLASLIRSGQLVKVLPRVIAEREERTLAVAERASGAAPEAILEPLGIRVVVGEASGLPLGSASADLTVTNSVLEHLEEPEIEDLLRGMRRAVAPAGVASHFIDLGDHYAVFDRRIDVYNFLKFTDRTWNLVNSRVHRQNRLRISDYRRLLTSTGWSIVEESSQRGTPADLGPIPLAPRFRNYALDDLLVYRSWIAAQPRS